MTAGDIEAQQQQMLSDLGRKRLSPAWAKVEILLGLLAVSGGHLCGVYAIVHPATGAFWTMLAASLLLQTLGGYLALAGHRSHLYQSQNKLVAWLAAESKLHR